MAKRNDDLTRTQPGDEPGVPVGDESSIGGTEDIRGIANDEDDDEFDEDDDEDLDEVDEEEEEGL